MNLEGILQITQWVMPQQAKLIDTFQQMALTMKIEYKR
jgi:hypothetical protein